MTELNGKKYRCVRSGDGYGGVWQFLYKGQWRPVKNYQIKCQLNRVLEEKDHHFTSKNDTKIHADLCQK